MNVRRAYTYYLNMGERTLDAVELTLEAILLALSSSGLFFIIRSKKVLTRKAVSRARFFLFLIFALILIESGLGIYLGFVRHPDTITQGCVSLALVGTAIYYSGRAVQERPKDNLGIATICIVWAVVSAALELVLGLILR